MVFTVRDGLLISSIIYRIRRDGREKMVGGAILQMAQAASKDKEILGHDRECCPICLQFLIQKVWGGT